MTFAEQIHSSECRIEIGIGSDFLSSCKLLNSQSWSSILEAVGVKIISSIEEKKTKALVLSHSTLVIMESKIVVLTCGVSSIRKLFDFIYQVINPEEVEYLFYQERGRLTEITLEDYSSNVDWLLQHYVNGFEILENQKQVLNSTIFLRHINQYFRKISGGMVLMYDLAAASDLRNNFGEKNMLEWLKQDMPSAMADYKVDLHLFSPHGLSLNGIKGESYFALHVSPDYEQSYASFESDIADDDILNQAKLWLSNKLSPKLINSSLFQAFEFS